MNKKTVKLVLLSTLIVFTTGVLNFTNAATQVKYRYNKIPIKQPALTASMKPAVAKYKQGNYVGAMVDLKKVTEKEPNNMYAKYYLALCYTQLGYRSEATALYQEVQDSNANYSLTYYSKRAMTCIDNPESEICLPPKKVTPPAAKQEIAEGETVDDMTQFIQSGAKIHPAAKDRIEREKMQRKIQADIYAQKHAQDTKDNQENKI